MRARFDQNQRRAAASVGAVDTDDLAGRVSTTVDEPPAASPVAATSPGPPQPDGGTSRPPPEAAAPLRPAIWRDRLCVALGLAGIVCDIALALVLWRRLPQLPELLPVHFNAYGEVDLIGARVEVLRLPLIGGIVWATNVALGTITAPFDRVLARLLLAAALLAQLLIAIAALRIIA